jgi:hypothetical protein
MTPQAAQASVGMCADTAQSIEAPPPLYPSGDAVLEDCSHVDTNSGITAAPASNSHARLWVEKSVPSLLAVLPSQLVVPPRPVTKLGAVPVDRVSAEEHRLAPVRPPAA